MYKSEGFDIVSSASGYTFTENNDFLSSEAVSRMVPEITAPVYVFEEIDSNEKELSEGSSFFCMTESTMRLRWNIIKEI